MQPQGSAIQGPADDAAAVFRQARDQFLQALAPENQGNFIRIRTSQELIDSFSKFQQFKQDNSRASRLLNVVKKCSEKLEPYFQIIGIVVQSHPEWTAIAWGAFRLVLQVRVFVVTS